MNWETLFDIVYFIHRWLMDATKHFWLASFMGLLGWGLTLTILSVVYWVLRHLTHWKGSSGVDFFIHFLSLLAGLALVSWSHALLDSYVILATRPLGPPLNLGVK